MTMMLTRRTERDMPIPAKSSGNLFDTVPPTDSALTALEPLGLYTSVNCLTTDTITALCPLPRGSKTFNGPTTVDGIKFAVYTGFKCSLVGADFDEFETQVQGVIDRKESVAVEKQLMQTRFTGVAGGARAAILPTAGADAPVPALALAYLEQDLGANYAGKGIIHAPRLVGSMLLGPNGPVLRNGAKLETGLGNDFIAGAGYYPSNGPDTSDTSQADDEVWMYATGAIRIDRGPLKIMRDFERTTNTGYILAERVYVVDVDCYLSAVKARIA